MSMVVPSNGVVDERCRRVRMIPKNSHQEKPLLTGATDSCFFCPFKSRRDQALNFFPTLSLDQIGMRTILSVDLVAQR